MQTSWLACRTCPEHVRRLVQESFNPLFALRSMQYWSQTNHMIVLISDDIDFQLLFCYRMRTPSSSWSFYSFYPGSLPLIMLPSCHCLFRNFLFLTFRCKPRRKILIILNIRTARYCINMETKRKSESSLVQPILLIWPWKSLSTTFNANSKSTWRTRAILCELL